MATIGNEGIVGIPLEPGGGSLGVRAISQVTGHAARMDASRFLAEVDGNAVGFGALDYVFTQTLLATHPALNSVR